MFPAQAHESARFRLADPPQNAVRCVGPKRRTARAHGIQHTTQAEQIAAPIHRLATRLFGRHILRRPADHAGARQAGIVRGAGQTEIRNRDPLHPAIEQNISRLDIAMNQSLHMRGSQAGCDLHPDAKNLAKIEWPPLIQPLQERIARSIPHHQKRQSVGFRHAMNRNDILMQHGGRGPRLRANLVRAAPLIARWGANTLIAT